MRRIREKLNSQSGASILMALLFFLVCAMVGASVLMASASNAGKSRSNRQEQQKYLTLSSAMQLVCDELTGVTYTAQFEKDESKTVDHGHYEVINTNPDGTTSSRWVHEYWEYHYKQVEGGYPKGFSQNVLPLKAALDGLVANLLSTTVYQNNGGTQADEYYFDRGSIQEKTGDQTFELTLTVTTPADRGGLNLPVKVTVVLQPDYRIYLTAALDSEENYAMYAELVGKPESLEFKAGEIAYEIEWTLSQITKQEGDRVNGP